MEEIKQLTDEIKEAQRDIKALQRLLESKEVSQKDLDDKQSAAIKESDKSANVAQDIAAQSIISQIDYAKKNKVFSYLTILSLIVSVVALLVAFFD